MFSVYASCAFGGEVINVPISCNVSEGKGNVPTPRVTDKGEV